MGKYSTCICYLPRGQPGPTTLSSSGIKDHTVPTMPRPGAFILLLFLLVLPVTARYCHQATVKECKEHTAFVPGHGLVGEGFDITTLAQKGAYVVDVGRWERQSGTCTLCINTLQNRSLQRLPVAVDDWKVHGSCQKRVASYLHYSAVEVVQEASKAVENDWRVGLQVAIPLQARAQVALAGSCSKTAIFSMDKARQDKYSFASHEVSCQYYWFRITDNPPLSPHFTRAVRDLPEDYTPASRPEYHQFIAAYGTHYLNQVHLGGRVRDVTAVKTCQTALDGLTADEVMDCLNVEAAMSIGKGRGKLKPTAKVCQDQRQKENLKTSFHEAYHERYTEVVGGHKHTDLLFSNKRDPSAYTSWLESLKVNPGLVSYSLAPLHVLVKKQDPRRLALQQAVSEYIHDRALWRNCTQPCPPGTHRSTKDPCSCLCPGDAVANTMCCSRKRGLGKLEVTIKCGQGLWGDTFTQTDAYIKVFYQDRLIQTSTVKDNNNPVWNISLDFGAVKVTEASKLKVQVWDKDFGWDDDLLGTCNEPVVAGASQEKTCYLTHGKLEYQYELQCGPSLGGEQCQDYVPQPPGIAVNWTWTGRAVGEKNGDESKRGGAGRDLRGSPLVQLLARGRNN
ncbi:perforin-1 isoform X1 [Alligator mississippiensis]|uniref:perforin-1 isoform X1 n=2 Tax=Alligator mississippiensis TaxID=8496 RepID=UPI002877D4D4|nr:perforin-1 isoform X1 [Alligator mississippiensis]